MKKLSIFTLAFLFFNSACICKATPPKKRHYVKLIRVSTVKDLIEEGRTVAQELALFSQTRRRISLEAHKRFAARDNQTDYNQARAVLRAYDQVAKELESGAWVNWKAYRDLDEEFDWLQ
ncbi:MAG: hypothetical protein LBK29_00830 [Oscillospiraceae bacterium]|jgi:hypothetical protein|nr:hypothetical protein [Oscillospiraceae bacterium]